MGLTMKERRAVAGEMAARYEQTTKKDKGVILKQLIELTGYTRRYAARLLRQHGKKKRVGKITRTDKEVKVRRQRQPTYGREVAEALTKIWMIMDCICGKRLKAAMADLIPVLKQNMEI